MTPIPDTYNKHGFAFKLIARSGMAAIYEQWKAGQLWAYEVVRIRTRKAREAMGVSWPAAEYLPSDADWGSYGKTVMASGGSCVDARKRAEAIMTEWATARPKKAFAAALTA